MTDLTQIENELYQPSPALLNDLKKMEGDIMLLGVAGKMGPSMARLAKMAADAAGVKKNIIGVSRFSDPEVRQQLEKDGIATISADLLNEEELAALPPVKNILYLAGTKFGTTGKEPFTWAMNAYLPGRVATHFKQSNIVAFSTGNVYPFVDLHSGGASEDLLPAPVGEYGQSCLGRERIFQQTLHHSDNVC